MDPNTNLDPKEFIKRARAQGVPDTEIYNYLKEKNAIPTGIDQVQQAGAAAQQQKAAIPEQKSAAGFAKNVVSSGKDLLGGVADAVIHPIRTAKTLGNLGLGVAQNLVGYEGEANQLADKVGEFYKERYGGASNIGNTLYNDPVGALADISTILGLGGGAIKATATAGQLGKVGEVAGVANKIRQASMLADSTQAGRAAAGLTKAATVTDPLAVAGKGIRYGADQTGVTKAAETAKAAVNPLKVTKGGIMEKIKKIAEDSNIDPQTRTALTKSDPVKTTAKYEKYSAAEKNYATNAGADTALEVVGSEIGKAYGKVIDKRKEIGATLGEARKSATSKADISGASQKLIDELDNSGVTMVRQGGKLRLKVGKDGTALTTPEVKMLGGLYKDIEKLKKNPTAQAISNFKQKFASEVDFAKGKAGVTKTTNVDRILKGVYNALDKSLDSKTAPDLQNVHKLESEYARLSRLLEEGEGILGKKTSAGDYTKDASLAKASIKSLHAGAKKDFLKTLGKETGNTFIEDALIAAQAMKDAGNFKQASLLEELATNAAKTGEVPTSVSGIALQGIRNAAKKGMSKIAGEPDQITKRVIAGETANSTPKVRMQAKKEPGAIRKGVKYVSDQVFKLRNQTRNATLNRAADRQGDY